MRKMLKKIKNKRAALALLLCCIILVCLSGCVAPPVAQISATPTTVMIGESITFSAADSTDPDGNIISYEWHFGDGNTASGATVTHDYSDKGGTYNITLTVTDDDGLSDTAVVRVNVVMGVTVKIKATSSTWREGEEPYDIYIAVKGKLEEVGFEVVPEESDSFDATLFADYNEKEGLKYTLGDTGTSIRCNLRLCDKTDNLLFEREISAYTPNWVELGRSLYEEAVEDFESEPYFKYLGDVIATKFGVGDEVSVLISALKDKNSNVREKAASALGKIGDERAVEPLIQALKDEDSDVRGRAADALGNIGDGRAVEPLIHALKDEHGNVRNNAADALGNIGDKRAVEPLIQALKDDKNGIWALGEIGDARAVEPLIQALKDEDWYVRSTAAKALGKIGDERAVEPLTNALEDEDRCVQKAAREALEKIQGK